jgi:hypothetical protein
MAINRVGLLSPCASDGAPFKEAINGHNAASLGISLPELGSRNTLSAFALMGLTPPSGSVHQCGINPYLIRSSERSPVLWFSRMTSSSWLGATS